MMMMHFLYGGGAEALENLDRPSSNFDVAGIPTGRWSSGIFACSQNIVPSCVVSFFCPCIMFGQIVIRAQIPLFIATKNSLQSMRSHSGYSFFVNSLLLLCIGCILLFVGGAVVTSVYWSGILYFLGAFLLLFIAFVLGHVRTAFKMKYSIPSALPRGALFWDCVLDALVASCLMPCAYAQMARHVFQYNRWPPDQVNIHNNIKDPWSLPPLEALLTRPEIADRAGFIWIEDGQHPDAPHHQGHHHRPPHLSNNNNNNNNNVSVVTPSYMAPPVHDEERGGHIYNTDGTIAR